MAILDDWKANGQGGNQGQARPEHQSARNIVTRRMLRTLAAQAPAAGGNGFSYRPLHALEQHRGEQTRAAFLRIRHVHVSVTRR